MYGMINVDTHRLINIEMQVKEIVETHGRVSLLQKI